MIGFCADCIRSHFEEVWPKIKAVHDHSRRAYGLRWTLPVQQMVSPVRSASTGAGYLREAQAFAAFAASNPENSREDDPMKGICPITMIPFYPHFYLQDLPTTSRTHAMRCKEAAERAGLHRVHIGNVHLLGEDY